MLENHRTPRAHAATSDLQQFVEALAPLAQKLGKAHGARNAFAFLWFRSCGRPAVVELTYRELGAAFGVDARNARNWIDELVDRDLIEIIDRDKRTGWLRAYVVDPSSTVAERPYRPDPQRSLLDVAAEESAHFPPRGAESSAEESAQKTPRLLQMPRAPSVCAEETAPKAPRLSHEHVDSRKSNMFHGASAADAADLAAFSERARLAQAEHAARPLPSPVAASVDRPARDRCGETRDEISRRASEYAGRVRDQNTRHFIFERTAQLVCEGRLSAGEVAEVLATIDRKRAVKETMHSGPGGYFVGALRAICARKGFDFLSRKSAGNGRRTSGGAT